MNDKRLLGAVKERDNDNRFAWITFISAKLSAIIAISLGFSHHRSLAIVMFGITSLLLMLTVYKTITKMRMVPYDPDDPQWQKHLKQNDCT